MVKSKSTTKALKIIQDNDVYNARRFAELMWPDSPCWNKVYNTGNGATRGKGMWLAGGSFLKKLQYAGFIRIHYLKIGWKISLTKKADTVIKRESDDQL